MPTIEIGKLQAITGPRALSDADRTAAQSSPAARSDQAATSGGVKNGVSIEIGATVNPSNPPVNSDRVSEIREALRDGSYPLVPAKIADAMIAAQVRLEIGE
ncbi:MAG: flagellar biosynthesis anti-sigma factor FlgM [Erythrobacter sp.]